MPIRNKQTWPYVNKMYHQTLAAYGWKFYNDHDIA